jgi:hypothetical protein
VVDLAFNPRGVLVGELAGDDVGCFLRCLTTGGAATILVRGPLVVSVVSHTILLACDRDIAGLGPIAT